MKLSKSSHFRPLGEDRSLHQHQRQMLHMLAAIEASRAELSRLRAELRKVGEESVRDPLTNLLNTRGLERAWERFASAFTRGHYREVAIAFIDLNGFKFVNDYAGHDVGDGLLRAFGVRLSETLRPTDIVARVGGDEFVLVLPGVGEGGARALVDRIRMRSADLYMDHPDCIRVAKASGAGRVLDFSSGAIDVRHPDTLPPLSHLLKAAEGRVEKFNARRQLFDVHA